MPTNCGKSQRGEEPPPPLLYSTVDELSISPLDKVENIICPIGEKNFLDEAKVSSWVDKFFFLLWGTAS